MTLDGLVEVIGNRYPEVMDMYQKIQRLEKEIKSKATKGAIFCKSKLEERQALIDELIKRAESEGFTLFKSVYPKSSDSESFWIVTWPVKFFIPTYANGIISEIDHMKTIIEGIGGLFVPHNAAGYYKNDESAGTINILIPPESISINTKIESSIGNDTYKITMIKFPSRESIVCFESTGKRTEIAIINPDIIINIDFD